MLKLLEYTTLLTVTFLIYIAIKLLTETFLQLLFYSLAVTMYIAQLKTENLINMSIGKFISERIRREKWLYLGSLIYI